MPVPRLGTVWVAGVKIKFIDDSGDIPKWVTVGSCMDTPKAIGEAVAKAAKKHPGKTLWAVDCTGSKRIVK